ncbi:MAG: glycosyltransferase [Bacillota bacterium]
MDRTAHPITLGFVGNVAWWQGLDTVVRGITSPDFQDKFRLVVVGDGEYLPKVRELAAGAPNVIFTGSLPGKEIPSVLKTFNVGVVSKSIRGEGLSPLKLYEYWAAGLPVLATNLPGLDIVEHVKGGALYEMDDVDSFKSALSYMVGQRDRWADWGQNGRTYVCEHASWARIGMDTATFVSSLV